MRKLRWIVSGIALMLVYIGTLMMTEAWPSIGPILGVLAGTFWARADWSLNPEDWMN